MRKIYITLLSLFTFFFWSTKSTAQVSTYVFIQSSGTYTENTDAGRVILGSATSDDQVFNNNTAGQTAPQTNIGFPIGFSFTYNDIAYDRFAVNNNGWIVVATGTFQIGASSGSNYTPLSSLGPVGVVNAIAGLARDLQGQTGSELSYQTLGTAPNRVLVVQWKGYRRFVGTGQNYNFQIRLNETSNSIQVVYGSFTESSATSANPQVGLRGATNADYNNRTGLWAASTAGLANNASMTLSTAAGATPVSGLTYTWLTPPPCVAPPGGGTTTGPAGTVCAGSPFTLSVTGASFGTGLTYLWESSPDGSTWGTTGVTTITYTGSITTNTYFRRRITCSGVDAYSSSLLVSISPPIAIPFLENFSTYATIFPPTCWTRNNTTYLAGFAPSAYGAGTGSARFQFYFAPNGTILDLTTTSFAPVPANYFLTFDHAYATFAGEVDQLQILYSTNGGTSYTNLTTYLGGSAGPLNTAGTTTAQLTTPTATQWATKIIALPAGTNKLIFRGLSAFGNNLFLDNIAVVSCLAPTGLGLAAITPTTATVSWTASPSNPSGGYEWEVRTSGAGGSGATGLVANGATAAGVTSDLATGLTANTNYSLYVRSNCNPDFSTWAGPYAFTTPCNPIGIPFTETFTAATFPPTCWTRNNTTFLLRNTASAYGLGTGSAKFDFYNAASGTNLDLVTPPFTAVPAGYRLTFDHAYATFVGEVDQLQISYSTDGGATYTNLITYLGGGAGPLNTGGASIPAFTPVATQWSDKAVNLPVGTNRLRFRGVSAFGNNLYLDNITVELTPSCLPVTGVVNAVAISPTDVIVSFTPPATTPTVGYIVEYGPVNFIPGTTNTPGTGGTVVFGAGSPITVSGLTPNTTYDFYVRKICIAGVDFSINKKTTATTLCSATNIPYLQNFSTATPPAGFPTCTSMEDVNGNSGPVGNSTGGRWTTFAGTTTQTYVSPVNVLRYLYDLPNPARGADDWFYIQGLNLTAGTSYRLKFFYKGSDGPTWVERLEVKYGTAAHSSAMTNLLYTNNNIATAIASPWDSAIVDFSPVSTGVYYIGFHATSLPDQAFLYIDDISVRISPLVDVGVTGIVLPSLNCPTNGVFVQATVRNYNTTTLDFATYPVTVTANITGAGTGTLSTLLNTGTLAPGASMTVYVSPAFNFSAGGIYNITATTSTNPASNDPETGNDSYSTSINVNPNPPVPVITPPSAAICAGIPVLLSTQFTASPPPVTLPAVSSGPITVAVPDAAPAGTTHTLVVNTVPAGANVVGISVTLNMTHTWIGDMIINLRAPNGNVLNLINQKGGSGDNLVNTTISSTSTLAIPATGAPFTNDYRPDANAANPPTAYPQNVTSYAGLYSVGNGNWTLALRDNAGLDLGTLTSWSITLTYQVVTPTITWTPAGGLYTNAGATTAYTGGNAFSLYANPPASTTYTVTATTVAGCTASSTVAVTVNPFPVITVGSIPDTVCISDPLIALPATPVGGSWSGIGVSGNTFVPPATAVGTYTLTYTYTSPAGCTSTATRKISVKDCPERIILLRDNALTLFPNPNTGQFYIRVNSVLYNNLMMKVYANNGTLVKTQQLSGLAWGRVIPIDLGKLSGGVYMVKFYYDGGARTAEKTFKVIIGVE